MPLLVFRGEDEEGRVWDDGDLLFLLDHGELLLLVHHVCLLGPGAAHIIDTVILRAKLR